MLRRIALIAVSLALAVLGLGTTQASAATLFDQPIQVGIPSGRISVPGAPVTLSDVQVTAQQGSGITASANLYAGTNSTPVQVSLQYSDKSNWTITLQRNGAPASYAPASGSSLNINALDGTITDTGGYVSFQLTLHGYVMGDATLDMAARITSTGFEASSVVEDLRVGGFTLHSATVSVSSATPYADVRAQLESDAGSFDIDMQATATGGGGYHVAITADGADLEASGPGFTMQSFGFSWESDVPASGCPAFDVAIHGTLLIGNTTYALNNGELALSCSTVTKFVFSVTVSHTPNFDPVTKSATLTISWFGARGVYTPTFGPNGKYTLDGISYMSGFFGTMDLSRTRNFSRDGFDRTVTLGLGFNVAVYTPAWMKIHSGGMGSKPYVTYSSGTPALSVGASGYFDADRVSGQIACTFNTAPKPDFTCGGDMRVNPKSAGIWNESWGNM